MKWNHRVVDMTAENGGEPLFALREVFYNDDGVPTSHGEPNAVSEGHGGIGVVHRRDARCTKASRVETRRL
jgi:hypothetical protein